METETARLLPINDNERTYIIDMILLNTDVFGGRNRARCVKRGRHAVTEAIRANLSVGSEIIFSPIGTRLYL